MMTDALKDRLSNETPYESLGPGLIMQAVETLGYRCTGAFSALNSYENRVYDVSVEAAGGVETEHLVVKFYRPFRWTKAQIEEEHRFSHQLAEADIAIVEPLVAEGRSLFEIDGYFYCVYPRRRGQALELRSDEDFRHMGRLVGRIHAVGAQEIFTERLHLTPKTYGWDNWVYLRQSGHVPSDLLGAYDATVTQILTHIDQIWPDKPFTLRTHGDFHLGNLFRDYDFFFVDLDDCLTGPAIQDLWLLCTSHEHGDMSCQLGLMIEGYSSVADFNFSELQLVECLRVLRKIHHMAWVGRRWADPAFVQAFSYYKTQRYWQENLLDLKENMGKLEEPLLVRL